MPATSPPEERVNAYIDRSAVARASGGLEGRQSDCRTFGYSLQVARTTLRAKGQLTLPEEIRTAAHLAEGDLLDAEITEDGILLRPQKVIDATQAWFWTPEWQAGEREADADIAAGRGETFESGEEFLEALGALAKPEPRPRRRK